jgi:hypothetical protein
MATKSELENECSIREYKNWEELKALWQDIQNDNTSPNWQSGKAFEYLIIRAFELEVSSKKVRYPYGVSMNVISPKENDKDLEQIDGVVYVEGIACLIECKDYRKKIDFEPIAKLRNQLMRRPSGTIASIFSMEGFTEPAMMLLNFIYPQTILAWEADEIEYCLQNESFSEGLIEKYRKAVEEGKYKHQIGVTP